MVMFPSAFDSAPNVSNWFSFEDVGKIRMISGKVEIGQGINAAFIQIAAEELDVDPNRIEILAGDTRSGLDGGTTAGSKSMETEGIDLRKAASAAKVLLLEKAAELLQSDIKELDVDDGEIFLNKNPTNLTYWSISKEINFKQKVDKYTNPKQPHQRKLSGKIIKRFDLESKILGEHKFIHDLEFDEMLHARILRPPSVSSRLIKIDNKKIKKVKNLKHLVVNGSFVAVVAEEEVDVINVASRVSKLIEWSSTKTKIKDPLEFIKNTDAKIIESLNQGNVDIAEGDDFSVEASRNFLCHASIGTCCAIAEWSGEKLSVYTHSQAVFPMKRTLASIFEKNEQDIDIIHYHGSGCYGHNGADDVALDAALIANELRGRPIRVVWTREDELCWSPLAPAMITTINAKVQDSQISSFDINIKSPPHVKRPAGKNAEYLLAASHIKKPFNAPDPIDTPLDSGGAADRNSKPLYNIPNIRITKQIIYDLPWRTSAMRGLGAFVNVYAIETLMDDIAISKDLDPLEFRIMHTDDKRIIDTITKVAELSNWGQNRPGYQKGLAFSRYKNSGAYCALVAEIKIDEHIELANAWAVVDAGEVISSDGIKNQIEGGIVQASSCTLIEEVTFDGEIITAKDWETYPILKFNQTPNINIEVIDRPDMPFLGVGEAAHGPTAAAISNAFNISTGIRLTQLPLTRERIIASI
tara:strand:- start:3469 stop:5559 length:2091 start_codon:yes stop_codon:yes gene_type:complete